jgi:hypothetical protein
MEKHAEGKHTMESTGERARGGGSDGAAGGAGGGGLGEGQGRGPGGPYDGAANEWQLEIHVPEKLGNYGLGAKGGGLERTCLTTDRA